MLGPAFSPSPALHTSSNSPASAAVPVSSSRPSRLRGLSYLRTYTQNHLHSHSESPTAPPLSRSTSSPVSATPPPAQEIAIHNAGIQTGEGSLLPTAQGWPVSERVSSQPTSNTPDLEVDESDMIRTRAVSTRAPGLPPPHMRRSSAGNIGHSTRDAASSMPEPSSSSQGRERQPTIKFIPHVEARSARPSLQFTATSHKLEDPHGIVRVGRYSERDAAAPGANIIPVGFKSKVVSRRHCEFWCTNGQWYVKDVKSSSGTFLNHVRLSSPGSESRPYPVNDGDVVQLGIDFKGGEEVIFRCVKIRIECNRGWQKSLNTYNTKAHKRLMKNAVGRKSRDSDVASINTSECSICLNPVAPCQPLFVAPCSHVWHYKCIKNLLMGPHYPNFLCPNCRFVADLEADVEPPEELEQLEDDDLGLHPAVREHDSADEDEQSGDGHDHHDEDALAELLEDTHFHPTQPITISQPQIQKSRSPQIPDGARSATPTSNTHFAIASRSPMLPEGPMTPRNDAGPFVFDGSAGRANATIQGGGHSDEFLHER